MRFLGVVGLHLSLSVLSAALALLFDGVLLGE